MRRHGEFYLYHGPHIPWYGVWLWSVIVCVIVKRESGRST